MRRIREKLTYANVVATLALFLVLAGGTAFAATRMLPKNSVGARQLKKGAVTPAKLSKGTKSTLTGARGPQGPKGDTGPRGPAGNDGLPGPQGPGAITVVDATSTAQGERVALNLDGIAFLKVCKPGITEIELLTNPPLVTGLSAFGTYTTASGTVGPITVENGDHASATVSSSTSVSMNAIAINANVSQTWMRLDLHLANATCKLTGMIIPSTTP